ncbi:MAG: helix-turn-helix transcriptional regulator [Xanthomonadales bacterium]|nr:helix-turn-helix transcriptional regulator [Xanthomonadales bacterium]
MNMKIRKTVVQKLRKNKGWSQQHLADVCSLNLRTIQRVENTNSCSLETLNALLSVFELKRDKLEDPAIFKQNINTKETIANKILIKYRINWRKNIGLLILLFLLIFKSALYMTMLEEAAAEDLDIRWFHSFSISFGDDSSNDKSSGYMIIPMLFYFDIILTSILAFGIYRNFKSAAFFAMLWIPFMHLKYSAVQGSITPITVFVTLVLGSILLVTFRDIRDRNNLEKTV